MSDQAATSAFLKAHQIREDALRLRSQSFPSESPHKFASFLADVCEKLAQVIVEEAPNEQMITLISIFAVDGLGPMLAFIEGATSANTPASLVAPVEEIAERAVPRSMFIVSRQWDYNYSVLELRRILEEPLLALPRRKEWEELFGRLSRRVFAVSFPTFERDNALLHVHFAHEIAHPLAETFLEAEDPAAVAMELRREIDRFTPEMDPVRRAGAIGKTFGQANRLRRAAIEETISDTLCAYVFGPSSLFALEEVANLSESMDDIAEDGHPPWRFRLRHMLSVLERAGFLGRDGDRVVLASWPDRVAAQIEDVKTRIDSWLSRVQSLVEDRSDLDRIQAYLAAKCAYESVERSRSEIQQFTKRKLNKPYSAGEFRDEVPNLLERLCHHLPPNQIERTHKDTQGVRFASILASGWLYKLATLPPMSATKREEYLDAVRTLERLVLKAFELSAVKRRYDSWLVASNHGAA
jgi:hypothetical protein